MDNEGRRPSRMKVSSCEGCGALPIRAENGRLGACQRKWEGLIVDRKSHMRDVAHNLTESVGTRNRGDRKQRLLFVSFHVQHLVCDDVVFCRHAVKVETGSDRLTGSIPPIPYY